MPYIVTSQSIKPELMKANKDYLGRNTWNQAFDAIETDRAAAVGQLDRAYGQSMAQAYAVSLAEEQAIKGSNLGQGYKDLALNQTKTALNSAFESYKTNYLSSKAEIDSSAAQSFEQVHSAINAQANNMAAYANAAFDYLPWLYEKNKPLFEENEALRRFLEYETDAEGNKTVKGLTDVRSQMFDVNGQLTKEGVDFINMVQNIASSETVKLNVGETFTDYLANSQKNAEILQWLNSADPYSVGKSNLDTFNDIVGSNSNPYTLSPENFSSDKLSNLQDRYTTQHDALVEQYESGHKSEKDASAFMEMYKTETGNLVELATQLGVLDDIRELVDKVAANEAKYNDAIANPGKGNNRKNREWATSNALADYEELYDAIMKAYGSTGFENTTGRSNYRVVERAMDSYKSGQTSLDEYNDFLKNNISFEEKDSIKGQDQDTFRLFYDTKDKGKESIDFTWRKDSPLKDVNSSDVTVIKTFNRKSSDTRSNREYTLGRLKDGKIVISYSDKGQIKYYEVNYLKSKSNKAFIDYLKTFK